MAERTATGDGPVDAAFKAIEAATGINVMLRKFEVHGVTEGEDAQGEAVVYVEYNQRTYRGSSVSTNIVESSTKAFLEVINRIELSQAGTRSREERLAPPRGAAAVSEESSMPIPATQFIWFNGKLVPWEKATVHVLSHALHYGSSVFEGRTRLRDPEGVAIFRLRDHTRRLFDSAKIYRIPVPFTGEQINEACRQVIAATDQSSAAPTSARWCFAATARSASHPKTEPPTEVAVAAWEWGKYLGRGCRGSGRGRVRLLVAARGA